MAIKPVSDIVLEVVKAADPASYRAAADRLGRLAGAAPATETFADALGGMQTPDAAGELQARKPLAPHLPFDPALALVHMQNRDALAARAGTPYEQFEGFVLQSFVQSMLPKDSEVLFGGGTAGEIWRSMLAEQLGTHLAQAGGIGIAEMLADVRPEKSATSEAAAEPAASVCTT